MPIKKRPGRTPGAKNVPRDGHKHKLFLPDGPEVVIGTVGWRIQWVGSYPRRQRLTLIKRTGSHQYWESDNGSTVHTQGVGEIYSDATHAVYMALHEQICDYGSACSNALEDADSWEAVRDIRDKVIRISWMLNT